MNITDLLKLLKAKPLGRYDGPIEGLNPSTPAQLEQIHTLAASLGMTDFDLHLVCGQKNASARLEDLLQYQAAEIIHWLSGIDADPATMTNLLHEEAGFNRVFGIHPIGAN